MVMSSKDIKDWKAMEANLIAQIIGHEKQSVLVSTSFLLLLVRHLLLLAWHLLLLASCYY